MQNKVVCMINYTYVSIHFIAFSYTYIGGFIGLMRALDLLEVAVETLDGIRSDNTFNSESITNANGLFHAITQCESGCV